MTGRVGGVRSVGLRGGAYDAADPGAPPGAPVNPIIITANLRRDNRLVTEKLKALGDDENGLHGDLQVVLSAVRRMEEAVELLIAIEEGERPRSAIGRSVGGER